MKNALDIINSNKIYKHIFENINTKYKKYSKITGQFTIKSKSKEDEDILSNFDINVYTNKKAKIKSKEVEILFNKILKESTFLELLSSVVGQELTTNKEEKEIDLNRERNFYDYLIKSSNDGGGKRWITDCIEHRRYGYQSIKRAYNKAIKENTLKNKIKEIELLINSINNLPITQNTLENISVFAAKYTKDPHFFDRGTFTGDLLINALLYLEIEDVNKKDLSSIDKINKLYYKSGLLKDEISNTTTIYGLTGNIKEDTITFLNEYKESFNISVSNILKLEKIKCKNNRVFIFENPAVFHSITKDLSIDESVICTSGQLNLSSYMLLDKIENLEQIYYAGDFDPEGIQISFKIKNTYKDKVRFILYDKKHYIKSKSDMIIDSSRLKKLNNIKCSELDEIANILKEYRKSAYQELLINDYINFIKINKIDK